MSTTTTIIVQAVIQIPCFVVFALLVWKLGRFAIGRMFDGDDARTQAIAKGFADIVAELHDHGERIGKIETRLDVRDEVAEAIEDATTGVHAIPVPVDDARSRPIAMVGA